MFSSTFKYLSIATLSLIIISSTVFFFQKNSPEKVSAQSAQTCPSTEVTLENIDAPAFTGISILPTQLQDAPLVVPLNPEEDGVGVVGDGYATVFRIPVLVGQKIETLAHEMDLVPAGSYIRSILFDKDGNQLNTADTRQQFTAEYTGDYFVLVKTFGCKQGRVGFRVFNSFFSFRQTSFGVRTDKGVVYENQPGKSLKVQAPAQLLLTQYRIVSVDHDSKKFVFEFVHDVDGQTYQVETRIRLSKNGSDIPISMFEQNASQLVITPIDSYYFSENAEYGFELFDHQWVNSNPPYNIAGQSYIGRFSLNSNTDTNNVCNVDITRDGIVDLSDYSQLSSNFFADTSACSY